jgi:hypothetical protein
MAYSSSSSKLTLLVAAALTASTPTSAQIGGWFPGNGLPCKTACESHSPKRFAVVTGLYLGDKSRAISVCRAYDKNKRGLRPGHTTEPVKNQCAIAGAAGRQLGRFQMTRRRMAGGTTEENEKQSRTRDLTRLPIGRCATPTVLTSLLAL